MTITHHKTVTTKKIRQIKESDKGSKKKQVQSRGLDAETVKLIEGLKAEVQEIQKLY